MKKKQTYQEFWKPFLDKKDTLINRMVTKSHQTPRDQASKEGGVMVSINVECDWEEYIGSDTNQRKNLIGLICSPREIYIRKKNNYIL